MKKVNLNFNFKGLDGVDLENSNAGKIIATILANDNGKNPVKFFAWAQYLYKGEELSLDGQDLDLLKQTILDCQTMTSLSKAQVLEVI